jgi:hypothetical protein
MPGGGSKPGERRGGRKKGTPNKGGASIRTSSGEMVTLVDYARSFTQDMVDVLVKIAKGADAPPAARATSAQAVLDRGHGRPASAHDRKRDDEACTHRLDTRGAGRHRQWTGAGGQWSCSSG